MIRKLLSMLVIAAAITTGAQTAGDQKPVEQHNAFRLEHADVPTYPQMAVVARIFGIVEVRVTVKDGQVVNTEVKSSPPGPEILKRATIENIQTWRFYKLDSGTFTTKFIYQLETKKPLDPLNPKVELQLPLLVKITAKPVALDSQKGDRAKATESTDTADPATGNLRVTVPLVATTKPSH